MKIKFNAILSVLAAFISITTIAQHKIGSLSESFTHPQTNRNVTCEIFYPAQSAGTSTPITQGNFPVIIFGHGFLLTHVNYVSYVDSLTPKGYILCFATTEEGITPNHQQFGADLRFLSEKMQAEGNNSSSIFYQHLNAKTAIMGHSMGGGATLLAAENNANINAIITFAAAETNTSAITAASNINVPTLFFSGESDCVASPDDNQIPMHNNLNSVCKTHITITDGGHCFFSENSVTCSLGEIGCTINIQEEDQKRITFSYLTSWLDQLLMATTPNLDAFNTKLQTDSEITYSQSCEALSIAETNVSPIEIYPNPAQNTLHITPTNQHGQVIITNSVGLVVQKGQIQNTYPLNISTWNNGIYYIQHIQANSTSTGCFIKK